MKVSQCVVQKLFGRRRQTSLVSVHVDVQPCLMQSMKNLMSIQTGKHTSTKQIRQTKNTKSSKIKNQLKTPVTLRERQTDRQIDRCFSTVKLDGSYKSITTTDTVMLLYAFSHNTPPPPNCVCVCVCVVLLLYAAPVAQ